MTEHKMTAKEYIEKEEKEVESLHRNWHKDHLAHVMENFALQVATEAVEEEVESYERGFGKLAAKMHGESILKNIKKRLNDE